MSESGYYAHPSAVVDEGAQIGSGSKIWHFCHVMPGARMGEGCIVGQGCYIANVEIGNGVKIQNNVSVYDGVVLEDDVFCGPSCVFTNVNNPRAHVIRKSEYRETRVKKGASIGANATIVCGATVGRYAFIGAGAVLTKDAPDYALMAGVPAKRIGWMCACGEKLGESLHCERCGSRYVEESGALRPA